MQLFNIQWKWTVPNVLSLVRIFLVPCFAVLYLMRLDVWAFGVLLLSGLTDCLDGWLARKLQQITDCGKLLDPLSDKLTQVGVVVCLTTRYPALLPLMIVCFVKELCQGIGGLILLHNHSAVRGSRWLGKVGTVVFYVCMLAVVLWNDTMTDGLRWLLVGIAALTMLLAFLGYLVLFVRIYRAEHARHEDGTASAQSEKGISL